MTCGGCAVYPCDNSGGHLKTDKACDRFKPTENSKMNIEELRAINMKNAVVIEKDAEDLDAKNAVLKMIKSEIAKHRGKALTERVKLCETLLKQCGLDVGYAQTVCNNVRKAEELEEEKEEERREVRELDERRTLGDGVVWKDDREEIVLDTATFGKNLIEKYEIITYGDNRNIDTCTPFIYKDGYYQVGIIQLNKDIATYASDQYAINNIKRETLDTLHFIRSLTAVSENPFNVKHDAINVNNGVIVFDRENGTYELKEHSPDYRFNYKLPVDYNPDAPDTIHEMCVSQWVDEPDELYQIPAQALIQTMNEAPFKKAYLVQGERNAGKSTYLNLLRKLFDGFISGIALQNLNEKVNRFNVANLEGMMFNIYDDLGEIPMDDVGTFKNLTGSYTQNIERKHCGAYMGRVNAVHIYTCNVPPEFNKKIKKDTAFWFRWNLIRFTRYFKTDDRFTDIYTEENMSGFLNHILDMISRIFKNDGLVYQSDASEVREQWSLSTDVVHMFIEDNIEMGAGEMCVSPDGLQDTLKRYMLANDLDMDKCPSSIRALTDALEKFEIYHERVTTEKGKQYVYVIPGIWSICAKFICESQKRKTRQTGITE